MSKRANGEGSIRKVDDRDLWQGRVTITGQDGQSKRKTVYGKTKSEVAEKLRELSASSCPDPSGDTLGAWLLEWIEVYARPKLKQTTWESYETQVRIHLVPALGGVKLKDLTAPMIQRVLNAKTREVPSGRTSPLSARSVAYIHQVLTQAIEKACQLRMVGSNPCDDIELPAKKRPQIRPLSPDQLQKFLAAAEGHRHYPAFLLEWGTGLRRGELLGLRWEDVDFRAGTVRIRQALVRTRDMGLKIETTKTLASERTIGVPRDVMATLKSHKIRQAADRLRFGLSWDGDLVFCGEGGRPMDPRAFTRAFEKIVAAAGLPKVSFHDMRHSHATMLLCLGESSKVAAERLGHARVSTTMETYQHVLPEMQKRAVEKLDALLSPRLNSGTVGLR